MATSKIPIALNRGLDLTSPALKKEPGSLIDCLNYELTSIDGLARIDGFERYDGWVSGSAVDVWEVAVTTNDPVAAAAASASNIIQAITSQGIITVGVFISLSSNTLRYLPVVKNVAKLRTGDALVLDGGGTADLTVTATSYPLYETLDTNTYVSYLRTVQSTLRGLVQTEPHQVCGLHWFRNNLIEVRDAPSYTIAGVAASFADVGDTVKIGTIQGLVIAKQSSPFVLWIEPYISGTSGTSLAVMNKDGTTASTATASSVVENTGDSDWAYMAGKTTPSTAAARGDYVMYRSVIVEFTGGTRAAGVDPKIGDIVNVGPTYGSNHYNLYLKNIVLDSGSWATGTAAGRVELIPSAPLNNTSTSGSGAYNKIITGSVVRIGANSILTAANVIRTKLPGTLKLRADETHYVGHTYNFYGSDEQAECYLANGAGRAVWAKLYNVPTTGYSAALPALLVGVEQYHSYGNIYVEAIESLDVPKFVARLSRLSLALGYKGGNVAISVVNEPFNFSGVMGAQTLPMGDELTGLVEAIRDSTLVFGRRSISRLTGIADSITTTTVSPVSGALPYTCVVVGRTPMFTDQNGVSVLEQTETYSDFIGKRASDKVQSELRPKLTTAFTSTEIGGVYCAIGVRAKNQYRLIMKSGKVYSFCMTGEEPEICVSNYSNDATPRVPLAWSCEVQDTGIERIHVVWDSYYGKYSPSENNGLYNPINPKRVYELDSGWGFDGESFNHYFEIAPLYMDAASNWVGISSVRVFGKSHGIASLTVKARGIENDFEQPLTLASEDISLPGRVPTNYHREKYDVTNITTHANWGLGVSLRFQTPYAAGTTNTEPSAIVQVIVIQPRLEGIQDA